MHTNDEDAMASETFAAWRHSPSLSYIIPQTMRIWQHRSLIGLILALWLPLATCFQPELPQCAKRRSFSCARNSISRFSPEIQTATRQPETSALFLSSSRTKTEAETTTIADDETIESVEVDLGGNEEDSSSTQQDDYVTLMMVLLWGTAFLSALDRIAMSVAVIPLAQEFGFNDATKGSISAFFSVGYGIAIVPAGIIVASVSPRYLLGTGLAVWSLATIATPMAAAASLTSLLTARALVGAAESTILPSIQRLLSTWIPPTKKGTALATIITGFQSGTIAAYLLSPIVMDEFDGWRGLFYCYGAVGLLWLVPWLLLSRDAPELSSQSTITQPLKQPELSLDNDTSIGETLSEAMDGMKQAPWRDFATSPAVWAMTVAHAANNWGLYNNLAWTPTFFSEQYGLNVKDSALLSILPSVAGAVGGLIAGNSADALLRKMGGNDSEDVKTRIRKIYQGIALFGPALCLAILSSYVPEEPIVAQTLLMGTVGLQAFNAAGYQAANQEKAGDKWTGLLYSITSLPGVMVGSFAVYLTGQILDATSQDWSSVFALNAFVNVLGASAFVLLYNSKREFD